eukprot:Skav220074  [mRNA]  locus=scaffold262:165960:167743:+ [translate_table: standard]
MSQDVICLTENVVTFSTVITAMERVWQWQKALWVSEKMSLADVQPNVVSVSSTILACGRGRRWQQAVHFFDAMPRLKLQPNAFTFASTIGAIASCEAKSWQLGALVE